MKLSVFNIKGEETGREVSLDKKVFGIEPNEHAVYLEVKQYLANQRQGTHKVKNRNEVSGSTKKIKKQKGTGTARAGSIKSPVFRGGGTMFGPTPRDYSFKLNKKVKKLAKKSALSAKAAEKQIKVLEDFNFESPKTKDFTGILASLAVNDKKSLVILGAYNENVYLSSRNIKNTKVATAEELSTYDLVNADQLILVESSVDLIQKRLN
ncbi:MAG: 50S ribosomal protein L4 [Flammeovirgaceae bacterium]|nr:50S ribosomal protein L4 [Flammeovirgaceae bacterium]MBE63705.1 50S ribosomal protein L4 [Flammeovirgaceae bacterium]MBS42349.1 50S ribosomal protein L4 [Nocardioides sp.]|tara:strand:+ start:808 stop:1434 length:627 start_codon:yes stop_codon:yes gene_type:complete